MLSQRTPSPRNTVVTNAGNLHMSTSRQNHDRKESNGLAGPDNEVVSTNADIGLDALTSMVQARTRVILI